MDTEQTVKPRLSRQEIRAAVKVINGGHCICTAAKKRGLAFCVSCFGMIGDPELRRALYRHDHFVEKWWAAVEHLARPEATDDRKPLFRNFITTTKKAATKTEIPSCPK